jgi:hypothetical protein
VSRNNVPAAALSLPSDAATTGSVWIGLVADDSRGTGPFGVRILDATLR